LAAAWIAQEQAAVPRRFEGATVQITPDALVVQLADSEDLRVEREGTVPIWSAEAKTVASSRVLVGVLLCLQHACTAETLQLSSEKRGGWTGAAEALTTVWGAPRALHTLTPTHVKADTLIYVPSGSNARLLREYFRAALEMDEAALPDDAFTDALLES
jgi:hypothetical protein